MKYMLQSKRLYHITEFSQSLSSVLLFIELPLTNPLVIPCLYVDLKLQYIKLNVISHLHLHCTIQHVDFNKDIT